MSSGIQQVTSLHQCPTVDRGTKNDSEKRLLETENLILRKKKLEEILKIYSVDIFNNTTVQ